MNDQTKPQVHFSLGQKAAVFAPAAATAIGLDVVLHAPLPLAVAGVIGAGFLASKSPEFYEALRGHVPLPAMAQQKERKPGEWTFGDRLLGKHLNAPSQESEPVPHEAEEVVSDDVLTQRIEQQPMTAIFSDYPDDETLRLGRVLSTGERFDPHFNALLGRGWVAAANQGFGKSILNGVIIEQAGKCGLPVIVLDHKGEYDTVKQLPFMRAFVAGAEGDVDYGLTPENVDSFIEMVIEEQCQAIVKLPSYGTTWLGKATIVAAIGQGLMRYAEKQRKLRQPLLPCLVIMDEAQLYLPQNTNLLPPEAQQNKDVLSDLSNAYFALVSNGRSAGYTIGFATQSLTYIAKWAIKSSQVRIFGRHAEKNDLDMCADIIDPKVASRQDIETLPSGVGVVFGFTDKPMVVKFDMKQSKDKSETPGMERLRQRRAVRQQPYHAPQQRSHDYQLNEVDADALMAEIMGRADYDPQDRRYMAPREQRAQYYQPVPQTPRPQYERMPDLQPAQHRPSPALPRELQQTLDAYQPGMSYRDLAKELGIGKDTAGKYIQELKRRGLI